MDSKALAADIDSVSTLLALLPSIGKKRVFGHTASILRSRQTSKEESLRAWTRITWAVGFPQENLPRHGQQRMGSEPCQYKKSKIDSDEGYRAATETWCHVRCERTMTRRRGKACTPGCNTTGCTGSSRWAPATMTANHRSVAGQVVFLSGSSSTVGAFGWHLPQSSPRGRQNGGGLSFASSSRSRISWML